jgi:hypothetical protein
MKKRLISYGEKCFCIEVKASFCHKNRRSWETLTYCTPSYRPLALKLKRNIVTMFQGEFAATSAEVKQPTFHISALRMRTGRKLSRI